MLRSEMINIFNNAQFNGPDMRFGGSSFGTITATSIPHHEHKPQTVDPARAECEVTVIIDGATKSFMLDRAKENIIDAGLRNGIELPYSCKGGVCSTCRAKLVSGEVDMDVNFALEDYEIARGFVLTCQSYPVTDRVTVTTIKPPDCYPTR
jgi:ring-1,2-phenylacetyl-CoA epoxidase subunit PaaE